MVGIWLVSESGYKMVWQFKPDGTWNAYGRWVSDNKSGKWWVQRVGDNKDKQLRISYGQTLLVHVVGSRLHTKQQLILGDQFTTDETELRFITKVSELSLAIKLIERKEQ